MFKQRQNEHVCRIRLLIQIPNSGKFECWKNQLPVSIHRWSISFEFLINRWSGFPRETNGLYNNYNYNVNQFLSLSLYLIQKHIKSCQESRIILYVFSSSSFTNRMVEIIASICNAGTRVVKRGLYTIKQTDIFILIRLQFK